MLVRSVIVIDVVHLVGFVFWCFSFLFPFTYFHFARRQLQIPFIKIIIMKLTRWSRIFLMEMS